ncbi:MAG: aminotransferase class III-fold pyridoxal phosphate-dependent enzyme [Gemmatimonadota bacterium]|nr:aminotransferase class III-fold pyridoxal phosphate-dependent enzyme [Gemmatimonadota bacterium]
MNRRTRRAAAVAREHFGIEGEASALPGEFDLNFRFSGSGPDPARLPGASLLEAAAAPRHDFVLKLSPTSRHAVFDLVTKSLQHLEGASLPAAIPRVVQPAASGQQGPVVAVGNFKGVPHLACALTWVAGHPFADVRPRSLPVLEELGAFLARLDLALSTFDHPELGRAFAWRMESAAETIASHLPMLRDGRELVEGTLDRATGLLDPLRGALPRSVIHNDANDYNVMVSPSLDGTRLSGLIDFGDLTRGWRAAEVAVAAAYAMMELHDPVAAACAVACGYSRVAPLEEAECRAIIPMVALRLCLSVSVQARQMREQPDNEYLAVSQKPAWRLLGQLAEADWRVAEFRMREACALVPNPHLAPVLACLDDAGPRSPVMAPDLLERPRLIDLSVESLDLPHLDSCTTDGVLDAWVEDSIAVAGATVGVGRYGEARILYDDPAFAVRGDHGPESRTIHLGLDLFAPPGTAVRAPLAGTVASVADNARPRDYGPTVILRHETADGLGFHTLYGHLDQTTLEHLTPGANVQAGEVIGWLGDAAVNGGWPPHLHVQIIALDPLYDEGAATPAPGDFPGVARQRLRSVWESILPDPTSLAGLASLATDRPAEGAPVIPPIPSVPDSVLRFADLTAKRKTVLGSSLSLSYARPVHIVRGHGVWLYDDTGRRYLDTVNNVPHVGHGNRRVAEAIARHSRVLNTNTRYLHTQIVALAEELLEYFPLPLEVVFLVCSGSEANELALRMARCHTGNDGVVCLEGGYHGNTGALVEISHYKFAGPGGAGPGDRVAVAPMPDTYRGRYRGSDSGALYADDVAEAASRLARESGDPGVAAFVAEPILSCGGQIEPPPGYLPAAFDHVRRGGGVCVADEVQVGFGRVGDAFWAFELQGVVPDIVTLGKPMGNGHPVAAVVTTRKIADSFANGMEYFSTFGGNPVSCAAARAVLAEIRSRGLQEHARRVGGLLLHGLTELARHHPIVGDVRGRGLFLGMEFVRDPESRDPYPEACTYIANRARDLGVFLSVDGPNHNVLKFKPPLVFGEAEAELLIATLDAVLGETALAV